MADYQVTGAALSSRESRLRTKLLSLLQVQGFKFEDEYLVRQENYNKHQIRNIHTFSRNERLNEELPFIRKWLPRLSKYLASGSEVTPALIAPVPVLVEDDEEMAALFRLSCLWWVGSSRVDLQACKLEYSIVSPK